MRHKYNNEAPYGDRLRRELLELIKARGHEGTLDAAAVLEAWNGRVDATSRGAALFVTWLDTYLRSTGGRAFRTAWSSANPIATPDGLANPDVALDAFDRAITSVKQRYGALDIAWGDTHRLRRGTLDLPLGGMPNALRSVSYRPTNDGKFVATGGDSYVLAVEFGATTPRAYTVLPYSESANPRSPHFNDQASLYATETFKPAWFSESDIAANLSTRYRPGR
jgi:acyl-homoserine-lactone acylase